MTGQNLHRTEKEQSGRVTKDTHTHMGLYCVVLYCIVAKCCPLTSHLKILDLIVQIISIILLGQMIR